MTGLCLASCSRTGPHSGILVVAIDGLEPEDLGCRNNQDRALTRSGFSVLCQEFLSIEGVIAPSTSVVANMASFLVGQEPTEIHVQLDDDNLSSKVTTWPEKIQSLGYRTAFFNSSPPISRKTNLFQGFGFSDENITGQPRTYYRPIDQTLSVFLHWLGEQSGPIAAVLTSTDIRYPDIETQNDTGEIRRKSVESQIEEIDESLFSLFESLKKDKSRWQNLEIIVTGLQGRQKKRGNLPSDLDLSPGKLVLPLFIKGAHSFSGAGTRISGNWTLAEVGKYVEWRLLEAPAQKELNIAGYFEAHKLSSAATTGCLLFSADKRICRKAFFDEVTWLPWDELIPIETQARSQLLTHLKESPANQFPRFSPKLVKGFDRSWYLGKGPYADCLKDFRDLKATQPFQRVCPSQFLQMLRKWFLVSKAKVENFSEMKEIRSQLIKQWSDFKAAQELWEEIKAQDKFLDLNRPVLQEILVARELLDSADLAEIRRELDRGN